jgi:recombination protein RecA
MASAAELRVAIETKLAQRIPGALSPAAPHIRDSQSIGIPEIDTLLGGGLPVGAVSEIVGGHCSGRTTLALSLLAQVTRSEQVCAWVDTSDALDPESAAANGVDLARLLWVRCGQQQQSLSTEAYAPAQDAAPARSQRVQHGGGGSPHPHNEVRGLDTAIEELLENNEGTNKGKKNFVRDRSIGTHGVRNLPLVFANQTQEKFPRKEQIAYDRMPSRRGDSVLKHEERYAARCAEPERKPRPEKRIDEKHLDDKRIDEKRAYEPAPAKRTLTDPPARLKKRKAGETPWTRLDQALRVTDLLLQAGGFRVIVLDLASIQPEFASRIPLATWFRYRAAAEQARCCFVLLTQHPCAKSSAVVVLRLSQLPNPGSSQERDSHEAVALFRGLLFRGLKLQAELIRHRFPAVETNVCAMRKPVESVRQVPAQQAIQNTARQAVWSSRTPWTGWTGTR